MGQKIIHLINSDEMKRDLEEYLNTPYNQSGGLDAICKRVAIKYCIELVDRQKTVEAVTSEWKYYRKLKKAVCGNCGFERSTDIDFGKGVACPNCGAIMK